MSFADGHCEPWKWKDKRTMKLMDGIINYDIIIDVPFLALIEKKFYDLKFYYINSKLPEEPNHKPFDDFLIKLRRQLLNE